MNVSLYQAASALSASARWQEVVSQNLASASTPGYKKQDLSFSAIQAGVMPAQGGGVAVAFPHATSTTSFQPGEVRATGVNTDVAIEGPGFFQVQLPNGATGYTRDGDFSSMPRASSSPSRAASCSAPAAPSNWTGPTPPPSPSPPPARSARARWPRENSKSSPSTSPSY